MKVTFLKRSMDSWKCQAAEAVNCGQKLIHFFSFLCLIFGTCNFWRRLMQFSAGFVAMLWADILFFRGETKYVRICFSETTTALKAGLKKQGQDIMSLTMGLLGGCHSLGIFSFTSCQMAKSIPVPKPGLANPPFQPSQARAELISILCQPWRT